MKKHTRIRLAAVAVVTGLIIVTSIQARDKNEVRAEEIPGSLMQQKLQHAQALLSALAVADYEGMTTHARELQRISLEARWSQPHSNAYADLGDDFRSALDRIAASADKQNIDGAALNYVQVVLTCVQCHKVVRGVETVAQADDADVLSLLNVNTRKDEI